MNDSIRKILQDNPVGALATVDISSAPWSTPLHLVFDDVAVYWLSAVDARHSQNIAAHPAICLSIWSPDETAGLAGLCIRATACQLDVAGTARVVDLFAARFGAVPPALRQAVAYAAPFGAIDQTKSTGNCWYVR